MEQAILAKVEPFLLDEGDYSSIGIPICKSKDRTIVEYALRESSKPIGVATYRVLLSLPEEMKKDLPAPDAFAKLLADKAGP